MKQYPTNAWTTAFDEKYFEGNIGLDIPPDWHPAVIEAVSKIIEIDPEIRIVQVKNKWGLRIYTQPYDPKVEEIILEAEKKVSKLMEVKT